MDKGHHGNRKLRFKPFFTLRTWWKCRRFQYLVHVNAPEECIMKEYTGRKEKGTAFDIAASGTSITPFALHLEAKVSSEISESFLKNPTANSFQDSIESMDSIIDSYCTHSEDETHEDLGFVDQFLMEHLNFLSQSTQPQEVELVYDIH